MPTHYVTLELLQQLLTIEGFATKQHVDREEMGYVRPEHQQIQSTLDCLDDRTIFPVVAHIPRRTGKQYVEEWKAMAPCTTFEGIGLNNLQTGAFNVVRVQLFRYWLFFHSLDPATEARRSPLIQNTKPRPTLDGLEIARAMRDNQSPSSTLLHEDQSSSNSIYDSSEYETIAARSDSSSTESFHSELPSQESYIPVQWADHFMPNSELRDPDTDYRTRRYGLSPSLAPQTLQLLRSNPSSASIQSLDSVMKDPSILQPQPQRPPVATEYRSWLSPKQRSL